MADTNEPTPQGARPRREPTLPLPARPTSSVPGPELRRLRPLAVVAGVVAAFGLGILAGRGSVEAPQRAKIAQRIASSSTDCLEALDDAGALIEIGRRALSVKAAELDATVAGDRKKAAALRHQGKTIQHRARGLERRAALSAARCRS